MLSCLSMFYASRTMMETSASTLPCVIMSATCVRSGTDLSVKLARSVLLPALGSRPCPEAPEQLHEFFHYY